MKFTDGYIDKRNDDLVQNSHMIFSVKEIIYSKTKEGTSRDIGFTILPLIDSKNYLHTGTYQLPLFKRDLTRTITDDLQREDPYKLLLKLMTVKDPKTKKYVNELLTPTSIMVRLKNNYFDKLYEKPMDFTRFKTYYLPDDKLQKYIYDGKIEEKLKTSKKMNAILPKGAIEDEFNELLRQTMGLGYNVQFDDLEDEPKKPDNNPAEE